MYDPSLTFLQTELNYRNEQLTSGLARNRRRYSRPRARRRSQVATSAQ
ncbi:MAG: hypothetical protein ACJ72P_16400 [Nocardioides sp.]|jgi:hypothetical protein